MDPFCHVFFVFVFVLLSCLLPAALWSPGGKGLIVFLSLFKRGLVHYSFIRLLLRNRDTYCCLERSEVNSSTIQCVHE